MKQTKKNTTKTVSENMTDTKQPASNKGGRFDTENTIKIKESYPYLFPEVQMNILITQYIENNKGKFNVLDLVEEKLIEFIEEEKQNQLTTLDNYNPESALQTHYAKIYNIAYYFTQYLYQIEEENPTNNNGQKKSILDLSIGKDVWNKYLAGTSRCIPTNMMEIILSKYHDEEQVLALMLLHLYAISNESIAQKAFQIIINLYDPDRYQSEICESNDIIKIIIQYIYCIIIRMNHHMQQSQSEKTIDSILQMIMKKYRITLCKNFTVLQFQIIN